MSLVSKWQNTMNSASIAGEILFEFLASILPSLNDMERKAYYLAVYFSILTALVVGSAKAQNPELKLEVQNGHSGGAFSSVAVSPDGKLALTGSFDWTALLWDLESGKQIRRFSGHTNNITSATFSKDGNYVLTSSMDKTARLWEVATGKQIRIFGGGLFSNVIITAAISPDMKFVAAAGEDKKIKIWDFVSGKELFSIPHFETIFSIAFSPDSRYLLTGSADGIARLYETQNFSLVRQFIKHIREIKAVAFSTDNHQILTGSEDKTVNLWNIEKEEPIKTFEVGKPILKVSFMPDGLSGLFGIRDEENKLNSKGAETWDLVRGQRSQEFLNENQGLSVAATPNGKEILLVSGKRADKKIHIFETQSGSKIREIGGYTNLVAYLDVSADSRKIITGSIYTLSDVNNASSAFWNLAKGGKYDWWKKINKSLSSSDARVREFVAISMDSKLLMIGDGNEIEVRSTENGEQVQKIASSDSDVQFTAASFSPDSKYLVAASIKASGEKQKQYPVQLWEIKSKTVVKEFYGTENEINSVIFSPDGTLIAAAGGDKSLRIWNIEKSEPLETIKEFNSRVWGLAFSPDGKTIATAENDSSNSDAGSTLNSVRGWDLQTGKEVFNFTGDYMLLANQRSGFRSVAFSPDGKFLAAGGIDSKIYIWDVTNGRIARKIEGHYDSVYAVKFSADGKYLVSGGNDSTTRIWNFETGEEVCKLVTFRDGTWAVIDRFGRYDASNGGEIEGIHWVYGLETIALNQLKDIYYTPNLLPRLLGYNKEPLASVRPLSEIKLFPEILERNFDKKTSLLTVKLRNRGGGVGAVRIMVNGVLATEDARSEVLKRELKANPNLPEAFISFNVKMSAGFDPKGDNKIDVITNDFDRKTQKSFVSSNPKSSARGTDVIYLGNRDDELKKPTLYAIVGGVSDYNGTQLDLNFAAKDAEDFANALGIAARHLFCPRKTPGCTDKVKIKLLTTNSPVAANLPTKANFRAAFTDVAKSANPEDILVVYLAGHGTSLNVGDAETYFFLTQESEIGSKEAVAKNPERSISNTELLNWLTQEKWRTDKKGIDARNQVLILDTCAAGAFENALTKDKQRDLSADQIRALEKLKDRTGLQILMGSAANQSAYEASQYGQGLLTYALLEGIKGAALKNQTSVETGTLFDYAVDRVPKMDISNGTSGLQSPRIFGATSIPIGLMLSKEDKAAITILESPLPVFGKPFIFKKDENFDTLGLIGTFARKLDESSNPISRGAGENQKGPLLVYVEEDNFPGAYRVTGTYTEDSGLITLEAVLRKDGKIVATLEKVSGKDAEEVTRFLLDEVLRGLAKTRK